MIIVAAVVADYLNVMRNLSAGHDYLLITNTNGALLITDSQSVTIATYLTNYLIRLSSYGADSLFCVYVLMAKQNLPANQKHPHRSLFLEVFCFLWLSLKPIIMLRGEGKHQLIIRVTFSADESRLTFGAGTCDDFPSLFKCA